MFEVFIQNQGPQRQAPHHDAARATTYPDFVATRPPIFSQAKTPMEADHWVKMIESKFSLLQCEDHQKVQFTAQQLQGPAGAWWRTYNATLPAQPALTWAQFVEAFHSFFIPEADLNIKLKEFLSLMQGNRTVMSLKQFIHHLRRHRRQKEELFY